jgi:predicted nucleic acid-binding protein
VIVVDTSVAVAAALPWHESHAAARAALPRRKTRLLAPVAVETYAVLTRLPPPHRVAIPLAWQYLEATYALPPVALGDDGYANLLASSAAEEIGGGAVYDAVVAATAAAAGATLLTLDRRAVTTYQTLRVDFRLVA